MRFDLYTKLVLTAIAASLAMLALRPLIRPPAVQAQSDGRSLYVEPGYTALRKPDGSTQVLGKVVIDLSSGKIWGFPTLVQGPYPIDTVNSTPPVSRPIYLGKFDFAAMK